MSYAKLGNNCSYLDNILTSNQKFIPVNSQIYNVFEVCPIHSIYVPTQVNPTPKKSFLPKKASNTVMRLVKGIL